MQRCDLCAAWVFYARPFCPGCGSRELSWTPVGTQATLYTWSVARVPVARMFAHLHEPVLAIAELSNGVRVPTALVDIPTDRCRIGMRLLPVFDHDTYPNVTLLRYRAADD